MSVVVRRPGAVASIGCQTASLSGDWRFFEVSVCGARLCSELSSIGGARQLSSISSINCYLAQAHGKNYKRQSSGIVQPPFVRVPFPLITTKNPRKNQI
jgi:hypothetical protein